jgi:isocitrate dehydrogenase (NAD+)
MSAPAPVTLIRGDGIGPEVSDAAVAILEAARAPVAFEEVVVGRAAEQAEGDPLPPRALESIRKNGVALKGPVGTPVGKGFASVNVRLRQTLELYANLRPVQNVPAVESRFANVDLVVVRENTESLYAGLEHIIVPGVVESLKIITEKASTRIARFAFEYAKKHGRKKVSAVHKANIMKLSDGLFLDCCRKVGREYPDITYEEVIVDNLCMQLVKDPTRFDMLVTENLYGDIVSDLCAGLVGGLGVVPGANIGERTAVFEAVHGTAPDIAGKGIANPTALMMSAVMMLDWLDMREEARRMESAIHKVYSGNAVRTGDLGGGATTREFTDAIIAAL